jgi:hypothetical protein
MTKKNQVEDFIPATEDVGLLEQRLERSDEMNVRTVSIEYALQHHKINGGMTTVPQLIENAKQFYAYLTGETK